MYGAIFNDHFIDNSVMSSTVNLENWSISEL